jgi:hypothetical protein
VFVSLWLGSRSSQLFFVRNKTEFSSCLLTQLF